MFLIWALITGFVMSVLGAMLLLFLYRLIREGRAPHDRQSEIELGDTISFQ